jgi:hypothetical protein
VFYNTYTDVSMATFVANTSSMKNHVHKLRLIIGSMCLLLGTLANGQTTDRVKYYIAYDASGSVAISDSKYENQKQLLSELIKLRTKGIESYSDFEFIGFGGNSTQPIFTDDFQIEKQYDAETIEKLRGHTSYNRKERFTHIHTALEAILAKVKTNKQSSAGVFLFTDGQLADGDIQSGYPGGLEAYKQRVRDLISQLSLYQVPVFTILTSRSPYSYLTENPAPLADGQRFYAASNYYWNFPDYNAWQDSTAFVNFINSANQTIVSTNNPKSDPISAAIAASQSINVLDLIRAHGFTQPKATSAVSMKLSTLDGLVSKSSMTGDEIRQVREIIQDFALQPDSLKAAKMQLDTEVSSRFSILNKSMGGVRQASEIVQENSLLNVVDKTAAPPTSMDIVKQQKGSSWEESAILGLTDYVIERAKFEAVYAFLDNMQRFMKDSQLVVFRTKLFPNVYQVLEHPEHYTDIIRIKELFQRDINDLPASLNKYGRQITRSEGLVALLAFYQLYNSITNTGSLETAFSNLAQVLKQTKYQNLPNSKILKSVLFTANLIGYLAKHDITRINERPDDLKEFTKMIIALALDEQNVKSINVDSAVAIVIETYNNYKLVSNQIKKLSNFQEDRAQGDFEGYRKYQHDLLLDILTSSADLMLSGDRILELIQFEVDVKESDVYEVTRKAKQCVDAYFYIQEGKYGKAGILLASEVAMSFPDSTIEHKKLQALIEVAGEVSDATTAAEVKNVIAKYALPVASYRLKRSGNYTTMITAYPGFSGIGFIEDGKVRAGITAPIGVEVSMPLGKHSSFSIMASLLDIGNIIDYRLTSEEGAETDIVSFQRIFSPGILANIGLGQKLPLAITGGYMINPRRAVLGLTLDLPLVSFSSWKHTGWSIRKSK